MSQLKLKKRLGDLLVDEGVITESQLMNALKEQRNLGLKLGAALIQLNYISETQLLTFLSRQLNLEFVDLNKLTISVNAVNKLGEVHARRLRALVVHQNKEELTVALSDPADLGAVDNLTSLLTPHALRFVVAREAQLIESFDKFYRKTKEIENFAEQLQEEYAVTEDFSFGDIDDDASDESTIDKLLTSIFEDAVQVGASDIHIEPDEKIIRIRQRVDGVLQENILNEVQIASALVLRLKLLSGLNISEKRLPQDGRFNIKVKGLNIDVRLSTMPIYGGEAVVMRLLNQSNGILGLEKVGMPSDILERFKMQLYRPHGMIVVTGPTGSGKTTTLYASLTELNSPERKIITVEDPVEYRMERINQVQVNDKIGLDFSQVLRTTLRQDPDVLLVGEMRDQETVEIGMRGALTGHLVLTTLHTNDAISSALRLIDMGAAGYLVASALRVVIAQRLIRKICDTCKTEYIPDSNENVWINHLADKSLVGAKFSRGVGCQTCNFSGFKGRLGVFELLELDNSMMDALRRDDPEEFSKRAMASDSYRPLALCALDYAFEGLTTISEVLRLVEDVESLNSVVLSANNDVELSDGQAQITQS